MLTASWQQAERVAAPGPMQGTSEPMDVPAHLPRLPGPSALAVKVGHEPRRGLTARTPPAGWWLSPHMEPAHWTEDALLVTAQTSRASKPHLPKNLKSSEEVTAVKRQHSKEPEHTAP